MMTTVPLTAVLCMLMATSARADSHRPAEQIELDVTRKPAQLLVFAGIKPGDMVMDFMPGNGYFTRIISGRVGLKGRVYAFLPAEQLANCSPAEVAGTRLMEHDPKYTNVTVLAAPTAGFRVPVRVDLIWTAQNYHDLHDSFMGPPEDPGAH
jgi:predicted methyltransferase